MRSIFASSIQPSPSPLLSAFQVRARVPLSVFSSFSSRRKRLGAIERDSEFEIDRDKAQAALEQLDKQLKALSEKETVPSRNRPSSSSPFSGTLDFHRTCQLYCWISRNIEAVSA